MGKQAVVKHPIRDDVGFDEIEWEGNVCKVPTLLFQAE